MQSLTRTLPIIFAVAAAACGQQKTESAPSAAPAETAAPQAAAETPAVEASTPAAEAAPQPEMTLEEKGRVAFSACAICHSTKDPDAAGYAPMVGPSLFGVYGSQSAHVASFNYSDAMRSADLTWDDATLDKYLTRPMQVVPGTRMAYVGEPNAEKRAALIAYLKTLK